MRRLAVDMSNGLVLSVEDDLIPYIIHADEPNADSQFDAYTPSDYHPLVLLVNDDNEVLKYKAIFECELDVRIDNDDPRFWARFKRTV